MAHFDETDRQILNMLIENGRTSYADIAKTVGMKSPSVIDRIKKMETENIITGYSVSVNYRKLGYDITALIGLYIDNTDHIENFERQLKLFDNDILECHHVTGEFTLILKVVTKNTSSLAHLIKKLRTIPGVTRTNTMLVFSTLLSRTREV